MTAAPPIPLTHGDQHPLDGGFYADDTIICVRTLPGAKKGAMGGSIAHAQDTATARAIVLRCTLFEPLLQALKSDTPLSPEARAALIARAGEIVAIGVKPRDD